MLRCTLCALAEPAASALDASPLAATANIATATVLSAACRATAVVAVPAASAAAPLCLVGSAAATATASKCPDHVMLHGMPGQQLGNVPNWLQDWLSRIRRAAVRRTNSFCATVYQIKCTRDHEAL